MLLHHCCFFWLNYGFNACIFVTEIEFPSDLSELRVNHLNEVVLRWFDYQRRLSIPRLSKLKILLTINFCHIELYYMDNGVLLETKTLAFSMFSLYSEDMKNVCTKWPGCSARLIKIFPPVSCCLFLQEYGGSSGMPQFLHIIKRAKHVGLKI